METSDIDGKWHFLYDSLPGGSFAVNNDFIIEDVNNVLCLVTGYTREELIGQKCDIICPKGPHYCPIFDLGKERIDNDETSVKTKDSRFVPIIKSARRLPLNNREIIVENFQDITARKRVEQRLSRLNQALLHLGPDYQENINRLTALCGELLGASSSLYDRIKNGNLCTLGKWMAPPDFEDEVEPEGTICFDLIKDGTPAVRLEKDLQVSRYAETDIHVKKYELNTYLGRVVLLHDVPVGALCAVYKDDFEPSEEDEKVLEIIASAISMEEKRNSVAEDLRESEEKYRELVQNANSIILKIDPEGRITFYNEFAAGFFGFKDCDVIGRYVVGTILSDSDMTQDEVIGNIEKIGRDPERYVSWEDRNILCSGEKVWISWTKRPVFDENGKLLEIVCIGNDITARRSAEEALKHQIAFEKIIAGTATEFINLQPEELDKGIDRVLKQIGEFTDVDRSYVFQFSEDTDTMSNTHEWCAEGIEPQIEKLQDIPCDFLPWWMAQIRQGKTINLRTLDELPPEASAEKKLIVDQGIISFLVVPLMNGDNLLGFLGFDSVRKEKTWSGEDITLLKMVGEILIIAIQKSLAVRNLKEEQAQLLSIFDSIDEAIYVADPATDEILYVNKCLADNLGKDPGGGICYREFQGLDHKCDFCTNEKILNNNRKPYLWEYHNPVLNKDYMIVDRIIKWPDGRDVRFEIAVDITDRKQLELERARAANLESLGILAGGIAHDFNNILTAVLGNISLIKYMTPGEGKLQQFLGNTEKAAMRAQELTQQLLTFSKGGAPIKTCASISQLVKESVDFVLSGSNSKCKYEIADDLWMADVDEGQINQVFNNIIINAYQSMPEGGVIKIRMMNVAKSDRNRTIEPLEGDYVKISIEDQGTGIPEDHLQRIFDPYFTTKQDGSGLGLATAYSIIKKHSGYISVKSTPGKGSVFDIYLPASFETAEPDVEDDELTGKLEGRVLIMDDQEVVRQTLGAMLNTLGLEVEYSHDGDEAVRRYRLARESGRAFDVVILDLTIPGGKGGKETIGELLAMDPNVKAIVSSGYSNDAIMADFSNYGFSDVAAKPYRYTQIKNTLTGLLNRK